MAYAQRVEEPVLEGRFGRKYLSYKRYVPMFWSFPLRKILFQAAACALNRVSYRVNRPLIWRHRQHFFFVGYGIWVGIGVLMGLVVLNILLWADGISARHIQWLLIVLTLSALSGSRFVSMLVYRVLERCGLRRAWFRVGFVSWGVLAAALLSGLFFHVLTRRSPYLWFDAVFTSLMLSHFFGRLGCLFYGCCYGRETTSALHIRYSDPRLKAVREARVKSQTLYPTQIFSALYGMFVFATILSLWTFMGFQVGVPGALCFILYGTFRFTEEWYRYQKKLIFRTFSPAQLICLVLVLIGMIQLVLILPVSDTGYHEPIFSFLSLDRLLQRLHVAVLLALGLLTTFIFSYHRHEIGCWGKER
jgi:phosphatidylglycerol:prolipoprotein diacylglycerol transferase